MEHMLILCTYMAANYILLTLLITQYGLFSLTDSYISKGVS